MMEILLFIWVIMVFSGTAYTIYVLPPLIKRIFTMPRLATDAEIESLTLDKVSKEYFALEKLILHFIGNGDMVTDETIRDAKTAYRQMLKLEHHPNVDEAVKKRFDELLGIEPAPINLDTLNKPGTYRCSPEQVEGIAQTFEVIPGMPDTFAGTKDQWERTIDATYDYVIRNKLGDSKRITNNDRGKEYNLPSPCLRFALITQECLRLFTNCPIPTDERMREYLTRTFFVPVVDDGRRLPISFNEYARMRGGVCERADIVVRGIYISISNNIIEDCLLVRTDGIPYAVLRHDGKLIPGALIQDIFYGLPILKTGKDVTDYLYKTDSNVAEYLFGDLRNIQ